MPPRSSQEDGPFSGGWPPPTQECHKIMALLKIVSEGPRRVVDAESSNLGSVPSRSGLRLQNTIACLQTSQYTTEIPATTDVTNRVTVRVSQYPSVPMSTSCHNRIRRSSPWELRLSLVSSSVTTSTQVDCGAAIT